MTTHPTLRRALELAVATEELGGQFYRDMATRFADRVEVAEVFRELARDEDEHETHFRLLLERVLAAAPTRPAPRDDVTFMLRAVALSEFFGRKTFGDLEAITTARQALARALEFEKTTLLYYETLRDALGPAPELEALVQAEKGHVVALARVILSDRELRGGDDDW
jgi:rubrerythrin